MGATNLFARERGVKGKVVLITGAARGLGAGVAKQLADRGAKIALVGLEPQESCQGRGGLRPRRDQPSPPTSPTGTTGGRRPRPPSSASAGSTSSSPTRGSRPPGSSARSTRSAFERTIEVDLLGVWRTVRVALPHVIEAKGYVLTISSLAAITHAPAHGRLLPRPRPVSRRSATACERRCATWA